MQYPKEVEKLISSFCSNTNIGRKSAEKVVLSLLNLNANDQKQFIEQCKESLESTHKCPNCNNITDSKGLCDICKNPNRTDSILCIISYPEYLVAIEKGNFYQGKYYVLYNELTTFKATQELNVDNLLAFIKSKQEIEEIILSMNPTIEGTMMAKYLENKIAKIFKKKISNLAVGIPIGSKIIYMDELTIESAFKNRR